MGGKTEIIYGDRHGEMYQSFADVPEDKQPADQPPVPIGEPTLHTYYPHSVIVDSFPGTEGVSVTVQAYDQDTGRKLLDHGDVLGTTLSREGCNRLIKAIRKHRDLVFGADA